MKNKKQNFNKKNETKDYNKEIKKIAEQELAEHKIANAQLLLEVQQDKLNSDQKIQQLQERIIQEHTNTLNRLQANIVPKRLPMNNSQPQYNG
jgi:hypothetical protein